MKKILRSMLPATIAVLASSAALANPIIQNGIESIDLDLGVNQVEIHVHNSNQSNFLGDLSLALQTTHLDIPAGGSVKCSKGNDFNSARIGFGAFNPTFFDALVVHKTDFPITGIEWTGGQWLGEAMDPNYAYHVPVASLKDAAKPAYQVDPLAEVEAMRQAYVNNGGTDLGFYRTDHEVVLDRKVSVHATCWTGISTNAIATKHVPLSVKVVYDGDEDLANFKLNAQLVTPNSPQLEAAYIPFDVTSGKILAYTPVYIGSCPKDLSFRSTIKTNGEGALLYRVLENGQVRYQSPLIEVDKNSDDIQEDYVYELEWDGPVSLQKKDREFVLKIASKAANEDGYPTFYNEFDRVDWSHTCTPKLKVGLGGSNGGGILIQNNGQQGQQVPAPSVGYNSQQPAQTPARATTTTPEPAQATREPASREPATRTPAPGAGRTPASSMPDPQ